MRSLTWSNKIRRFFSSKNRLINLATFSFQKNSFIHSDCRAEREGRDRRERDDKKKQFRKDEDAKKAEDKARKEAAELRSYDRLMVDENMSNNKDGGNDSDDFM